MKREEHNGYWSIRMRYDDPGHVDRLPDEQVHCNTGGYGELSQYDPKCNQCWLGHQHTWNEHDRNLDAERATRKVFLADYDRQFDLEGPKYKIMVDKETVGFNGVIAFAPANIAYGLEVYTDHWYPGLQWHVSCVGNEIRIVRI